MTVKVALVDLGPIAPAIVERILAPIGATVAVTTSRDEADVIAIAHDADAIIGPVLGTILTPAGLDQLERCRVVSIWAGSTDFLDADSYTQRGIAVCFAADASTEEIANHGMALMLAVNRKLFFYDGYFRERGGHLGDHNDVVAAGRPYPRLSNLTAGTIGLGRAGLALAARVRPFGMRFLAHDPFVLPGAGNELGVELVSKERLLAESDFVHIHLPMKADTQKIIGASELALMKPSAYLVNCAARSGFIDEPALVAALQEGRLAGAALDNLDPVEGGNPLLGFPNVIVTPHIAHVSDESYEQMIVRACDDVRRFFTGEWPPLLANPRIKELVRLPGVAAGAAG